jgi:sporulation protein YabP
MYSEQEKKETTQAQHHSIRIDNRERLMISGVEDVDSFDESSIVVLTHKGVVGIVGSDLHISKLSLEEGQLIVAGNITGVTYEEPQGMKDGDSIWKRLFR